MPIGYHTACFAPSNPAIWTLWKALWYGHTSIVKIPWSQAQIDSWDDAILKFIAENNFFGLVWIITTIDTRQTTTLGVLFLEKKDPNLLETLLGIREWPRNALNHWLIWVAREGFVDAIQPLLKAGADVNASIRISSFQRLKRLSLTKHHVLTALQAAAYEDHLETVTALLAAGAHPNAPVSFSVGDHQKALYIAVQRNDLAMAQTFLKAGADMQAREIPSGRTALHEAILTLDPRWCMHYSPRARIPTPEATTTTTGLCSTLQRKRPTWM